NNMTEGVLVMDKEGVISLHNAAAMSLLNTNQTLSGKKPENFITFRSASGTALTITELLPNDGKPLSRNDIVVEYGEDDSASLGVNITPLKASFGHDANDSSNDGFIVT